MDSQQLPKPQPAELSAPQLLGLTQLQKQIIAGIQAQYAMEILRMQFNEPDSDSLMLRQHANVHGAMQAMDRILRHDEVVLQEFEDVIRNQANK